MKNRRICRVKNLLTKMKRLTPVKSIRKHCLWCCKEQAIEVRECPTLSCAIHPYRLGKRRVSPKPPLTPIRAIRAKCLNCSGWDLKETRQCTPDSWGLCNLYQYRLGKRPIKPKPIDSPLVFAAELKIQEVWQV
jgi:hypothetical protein